MPAELQVWTTKLRIIGARWRSTSLIHTPARSAANFQGPSLYILRFSCELSESRCQSRSVEAWERNELAGAYQRSGENTSTSWVQRPRDSKMERRHFCVWQQADGSRRHNRPCNVGKAQRSMTRTEPWAISCRLQLRIQVPICQCWSEGLWLNSKKSICQCAGDIVIRSMY